MSIAIGQTIPMTTGAATILAMRQDRDRIIVLAHRDHPHHAYATWAHAPGRGLFAGHYFQTLPEAEIDYRER